MKKLLNGRFISRALLAMVFSLSLSLTSCGGQDSQESTEQEETTEEKQAEEATGNEEHPTGDEEHPNGSDGGDEHPN